MNVIRVVPLLAILGCASVQPIRDPAKYITESAPSTVYVTHVSGAQLTISQPRVQGDSLVGIWQGTEKALALPFAELRQVEAKQSSKTRTILLLSGAVVVGAAMGYMLTQESSDERQACNFEGGHHAGGCDTDDP